MSYCRECGNTLKEGVMFCGKCGTAVSQTSPNQTLGQEGTGNTNQSTSQPVNPQPIHNVQGHTRPAQETRATQKKPLSKKSKVLLISGITAIILLFGIHKTLEFIFSPQKIVDKFEQALLDNDGKEMANILASNDPKLVINESSVQGFMDYFEENPQQVNEVVLQLQYQAESFESGSTGIGDGGMVTLENAGKFLLYPQYQLSVPAVYLEVETNYKDTVVTVNETEVGIADTNDYRAKVGPFLPGIHTVNADLKTAFVELSTEKELLLSGDESLESVDLYLEANDVAFELPTSVAFTGPVKLYINGKDTGVDLVKDNVFGPVKLDGSFKYYVEIETANGKVKTEESTLDYYYETIDVNVPKTATNNNQGKDAEGNMFGEADFAEFMKSYMLASVDSINQRDFTVVESYFDPEGKSGPEHENYLKYLEEKGITETLNSFEVVDYEKVEGGYIVTTNENYNIYYADGSGKNKTFESEFYITESAEGLQVHTLNDTTELASVDL